MRTKRFLNLVMAVALLLPALVTTGGAVQSAPGQPTPLPNMLPVYPLLPTSINHDIILRNASRFDNIKASDTVTQTSRGGLTHFFALDPTSGDMLEQFDRGGGLFAVNSGRAYTETQMTANPTNSDICLFLANHQFFPDNAVEPQYTNCRLNPPYIVKQIHLSTLMTMGGATTQSVIGELVQVPLAIDIGGTVPFFIPLGGPGGHLSILLAGDANTPPLDSSLPGLQGLAAPMFDRTRSLTPIGYYPTVPEPVAIQRFKAMFPQEMQVDPGTPEMVYYMDFPDVPQDAVMPEWTFPNATAMISGTLVNLKDTSVPGVEGFAPNVSILSPSDGEVIMKDQPISLTFSINGDKGPFTYTVSADDSVVGSGVAVSGTISLDLGVLPPFAGRPEGHILSVHAVNSYHIAGDDAVFLGSVKSLYLPLTVRNSAPPADSEPPSFAAGSPAAADSTLRIGVEWVMNYHNPKLNLSLTKADAEGLYYWLGIWGWQRSFDYGNDSAWEKDWRDCSLGGIDCNLGVDHSEFVYFSGHGSPSSWYFGVNKDYGGAWGGNARFQNVRWAAFSSCNTVRGGPYIGPGDPPLTDWFNSFKGSYMVLGFHSTMSDVAFGSNFGVNLYNPVYILFPFMQPSISAAWVNAAFQMNAGKPAYLYAVGNFNPANFKLPKANAGPLPPLTGIYQFRWVWWDE
jgi:Family of unknown function (DUF6345)